MQAWWFSVALLAAPAWAAVELSAKPIDPFDYSYCGGEPVYPVIGFNFATFCGPRNQIALGRRGELVWLFPKADGSGAHAQGRRQLSQIELKRLSLLAEVAHLADAPALTRSPVVYDLGIDFAGRPYKRIHATHHNGYTPANKLFRAMLDMAKDQPLLPECANAPADFNPTLVPADRATTANARIKP